jgi:hypothetical protein
MSDPKVWDAGYADGLAGRPHDGAGPLHQVDSFAYLARTQHSCHQMGGGVALWGACRVAEQDGS